MNYRRVMLVTLTMGIVYAATPTADHAWAHYHWARMVSPFTLKVGDNVSRAWKPHLDAAITDWNQSAVLDLVRVDGRTRGKVCQATSGQVEACSANYGETGWLGVAQIWTYWGHITAATAKLNDTYFNSPAYNTPAWRQLVMCQEIAHAFGLGHQDETFTNANLGSCMDYTSNPEGPLSNERPNQHDYDQLLSIYDHLDGMNTVSSSGTSSTSARDRAVDTQAQWGKLRRTIGNGRVQVFERDFGNGQKVITHVFWADGAHDSH